MAFQTKVFKSLNCSECNVPFSKNVNDRSTPQKFPTCGFTVCTQCFKNYIKRLNHGCSNQFSCYSDAVKPAYFLIELLNSPAIVKSSYGHGYCLTEHLDIPECVSCQEEYSLETEDRNPCELTCNHVICSGCLKKTGRLVNSAIQRYSISCPTCVMTSYASHPQPLRVNSLQKFLKELPGMTKQLETIKGQLLGSRKVEKTHRVSEETKQMVSIHIDGYKQIFPELHRQLAERIAAFENILGEKVEGIAKHENLEKTNQEFDKCKGYGERFERISEDYLPNLRSFDTNLQNLINELKEVKISETGTKTGKK